MGRQDRDCRTGNLVGLGGTLNQGDSEKGKGDYYPREIREGGVSEGRGDITRKRIPSGMGQGSGEERKKGERACIFHRKRWNEEQVGKSGERQESSGRKEVHAHSRCIVRNIVKE